MATPVSMHRKRVFRMRACEWAWEAHVPTPVSLFITVELGDDVIECAVAALLHYLTDTYRKAHARRRCPLLSVDGAVVAVVRNIVMEASQVDAGGAPRAMTAGVHATSVGAGEFIWDALDAWA